MEACLVERITVSLNLFIYRNATFLCERLYAESPSESNLQLLATCFLRNNQAYRAYHILKGAKSVQLRYLFALACYEMGNLAEAETALLPSSELGTEVPNGAAGYFLLGQICRYTDRRQAAIGHYTQALSLDPFFWSSYEELCLLGADEDAAALYGELAVLHLQQQQLLSDIKSHNLTNVDFLDSSHGSQPNRSTYTNDGSPKQSRSNIGSDIFAGAPNAGIVCGTAGFHTPAAGGLSSYSTPSPSFAHMPAGPHALNRTMHGIIGTTAGVMGFAGHSLAQVADASTKGGGNAPQRRKVVDEGKLRKNIRSPSTRAAYSQVSGRLFSETLPRRSTRLSADPSIVASGQLAAGVSSGPGVCVGGNGSGHSHSSPATITSPTHRGGGGIAARSGTSKKGLTTAIENSLDDVGRSGTVFEELVEGEAVANYSRRILEDDILSGRTSTGGITPREKRPSEGAFEFLSLMRMLAEGFRHLCMYRCQEALQAFMKLPQHHYATGWVLCQVGRAYFEMVDYPEAERAFSWGRRVSPDCLEGTDIFSTVLYHMKKEVDLSYLAQETISTDRLSPQAWCVMGNCFSLQKDHEAALKFFQRAIQLDSHFAYAHTLCGHEYVFMDDFEEGIACYRNAIRINPRHYNAWYGLGTIYFRQEKFEFAEYHFRHALLINNGSSVLHCYLGMALHSLKMNGEALRLLEQAVIVDPKNPLTKFQKANVLGSEERYDEALAELEHLKDVVPRESCVFFLMGKIYKRLNMPEQALYHFNIALDLKPSTADVNLIKTAIEKLHVPDDLEEENL